MASRCRKRAHQDLEMGANVIAFLQRLCLTKTLRTWLFVALKVNVRVQFFRQQLTQAAAA